MAYTPLPIGIDDFEKIRKGEYYYVDKTWFIKELLDKRGEANLFTRPRRFGKTLNMSMLRYFFEIPEEGKSNKELFEGLKIMDAGEKYTSQQEQYPVIMLTLKSAKQPDWNLSYVMLRREIAHEYDRHRNILDCGILSQEKERRFRRLMTEQAEKGEIIDAVKFLSECLEEIYQKKTIILIDEYDVPLENAFYKGFYDEMIDFIRSLFESALKTNPYLEFAVITGCLRISKESIFAGLNNLEINSILSGNYGEYFGFIEFEVQEMLRFYDRADHMDTMRQWYDGYRFGDAEVYNPWSVINYAKALEANEKAFPVAAWSNTSSNSIVRDLIYRADTETKEEIGQLIDEEVLEKKVHEDITYGDIYESQENLWNFLFFTGYLKQKSQYMVGDDLYLTLEIPNREVKSIYRNQIEKWFREEVKSQDLSQMYQAMVEGNVTDFQNAIGEQLQKSISYMDSKEAFYQGFLLGIMANMEGYICRSNRESGHGRYDILVYSHNVSNAPIILELKVSDTFKGMEARSQGALEQIKEKQYYAGLEEEGYTEVLCYGVAFFKKQVRVCAERIPLPL